MKKNEATKRNETRVTDLAPKNSKDVKGGGTAKPAIEIQDYGFGVSMPVTISR